MTNQRTFYVTKYAVSTGVLEVQGKVSTSSPDMLCYTTSKNSYTQYAHGKEWYDNLSDALADCERRRLSKISSLKKQLTKLEALEFKL